MTLKTMFSKLPANVPPRVGHTHDNGKVERVTAGANFDTEENEEQECIDGPSRVIPRE